MIDPKLETDAFRIWQIAKPNEWNVSVEHLAAALGLPRNRVRATLNRKGWSSRVRSSLPLGGDPREDFRTVIDDGLEDLARQNP